VEGFDGSGKTTLCKYISEKYNVLVTRSPGPKTRKEMISWIDTCTMVPPTLMDRFTLISERVYGPILREKCELADYDIYYLCENLVIRVNPLIIFCRPSIEKIIKGLKSEDHMDGVLDNCVRLIKAYDDIAIDMRARGFKMLLYDRDSPESVELLENSVEIELRRHRLGINVLTINARIPVEDTREDTRP